jgi:hypothetical protein
MFTARFLEFPALEVIAKERIRAPGMGNHGGDLVVADLIDRGGKRYLAGRSPLKLMSLYTMV